MDIVEQLRTSVDRFSAQESRVAAFILDNLSFTASASIEELATRAGVSPATITRFARSVGCDDIRHLRKQLAQASERHINRSGASLPAAWREHLAQLINDLERQLSTTQESAVDKLSFALQKAQSVHCFALGNEDVALATLLQHQLLSVGIVINLCHDSAMMRMIASKLSDNQLLLVLASGKADSILQSATLLARVQEATIITLTPENHVLNNMASATLPLPENPQVARYMLLMMIDLLRNTLIA